MTDLDLLAQKSAQNMVNAARRGGGEATDVENMVTKTLGVVQEGGVYSGVLFLLTRSRNSDKLVAGHIRIELFGLVRALLEVTENPTAPAEQLKLLTTRVCHELDTVLLVKQVWEQALIYARFGAKAEG